MNALLQQEPLYGPLGDSAVTGDPVPASAIWRVTPEPAMAGVAEDARTRETSNARTARCAMNGAFNSFPLLRCGVADAGES